MADMHILDNFLRRHLSSEINFLFTIGILMDEKLNHGNKATFETDKQLRVLRPVDKFKTANSTLEGCLLFLSTVINSGCATFLALLSFFAFSCKFFFGLLWFNVWS